MLNIRRISGRKDYHEPKYNEEEGKKEEKYSYHDAVLVLHLSFVIS